MLKIGDPLNSPRKGAWPHGALRSLVGGASKLFLTRRGKGRSPIMLFFFSLIGFSFFIPWHSFPDPDAFYHAHLAKLIWQDGPIHIFPWLNLTTLGTSFADHHFLFHVFESLFVAWIGEMMGARVVAILLCAALMSICLLCLRWLGIRYVKAWSVLLMCTSPLLFRLLLMKATPLALMWFIVGLTAAWKRKSWLVVLIAALFALSHGGWVFLVGSIGLLMTGDVLFRRIVDEQPWRLAFQSSLWRESLAGIAGAIIGIIVHPNFPQNISFLWVQIVKIGLGTPYAHVVLGSEWLPLSVTSLLARFAPWWMLILLSGYGLVVARREPLERNVARALIAFSFPLAACIALTFKSQRNVEYLAMALFLWVPWLWMLIEPKKLFITLVKQDSSSTSSEPELVEGRLRGNDTRRSVGMTILFVCVFMFPILRGLVSTWQDLHTPSFPNDAYQASMTAVSERASPGDRVFHSDWDEFPVLFRLDDRLRYVAGLDPTFLYEASSTLSDAYRNLTWGQTTTTPELAWDLIHHQLHARFVFFDKKKNHEQLLQIIKSDSRYQLLQDASDSVTFEVKNTF